ncbi:MAG: rhodanese-like domain-containing protein [Gammaproteobacteria bacterium]|nr:rhodanese-like domain-containing protein [Gammaproteobacteria bacterium]
MSAQLLEFSSNHPILVLSFIGLLALIIFNEFRNFTKKFSVIGPSAAISLINKENAVLVDVRETAEIKDGMLNGAIHIPLSAAKNRLGELEPHKDDHVLVYCRSGNRSGSVCRQLTSRGFEHVYNMSGGIMAWQDAHLPVQKSKNAQKSKKSNKSKKKKQADV